MAAKGSSKKASASKQADDERKSAKRYLDQPGQWVDTTPADVKARQAKEWKKLDQMLKSSKKPKKSTKK